MKKINIQFDGENISVKAPNAAVIDIVAAIRALAIIAFNRTTCSPVAARHAIDRAIDSAAKVHKKHK